MPFFCDFFRFLASEPYVFSRKRGVGGYCRKPKDRPERRTTPTVASLRIDQKKPKKKGIFFNFLRFFAKKGSFFVKNRVFWPFFVKKGVKFTIFGQKREKRPLFLRFFLKKGQKRPKNALFTPKNTIFCKKRPFFVDFFRFSTPPKI